VEATGAATAPPPEASVGAAVTAIETTSEKVPAVTVIEYVEPTGALDGKFTTRLSSPFASTAKPVLLYVLTAARVIDAPSAADSPVRATSAAVPGAWPVGPEEYGTTALGAPVFGVTGGA